ncbi:hypothetical protein Syun_005264 [Stephania yunnanensis]|uniref:Uncharacterized protein n=1 Tax=Stephania yunnanensis TaxID=152371 RepID=A0AAP0Q1K0_9MAGN
MMIERIEICMKLVKMAIEFILSFAEAVGVVCMENEATSRLRPVVRHRSYSATHVGLLGFLP